MIEKKPPLTHKQNTDEPSLPSAEVCMAKLNDEQIKIAVKTWSDRLRLRRIEKEKVARFEEVLTEMLAEISCDHTLRIGDKIMSRALEAADIRSDVGGKNAFMTFSDRGMVLYSPDGGTSDRLD